MTVAAQIAIDWRVGRSRLLLPAAIHAIAFVSTLELAQDWAAAWILVGAVVFSAVDEGVRWLRDRQCLRKLVLIPGGVQIDAAAYQVRSAWLGPGLTALWLKRPERGRRLVYVVRGEVMPFDHAALRRHVQYLDLDT